MDENSKFFFTSFLYFRLLTLLFTFNNSSLYLKAIKNPEGTFNGLYQKKFTVLFYGRIYFLTGSLQLFACHFPDITKHFFILRSTES